MSGITAKQRKALEALALGETRLRAAELSGVTEKTIYNWLGLPDFREELARARDMVLSVGVSRLVGKLDMAIDILSRGAEGDGVTADQIRSSNYLLNHGKAYTELAHFGERLEYALEQIEELKKDRNEPESYLP